MAIRENREMGIMDAMNGGGCCIRALLARLDSATPWETLAEAIAAFDEYTTAGPGRPAWGPVVRPADPSVFVSAARSLRTGRWRHPCGSCPI